MEDKNKLKSNLRRYFIPASDSFDSGLSDYLTSAEGKKISDFLNKKRRINISESGHSYRVINNWESKGLIQAERDTEGGWRRFSLLDIFWVEIISILRSFGLSLDAINIIKKYVMPTNSSIYRKIFEYYVACSTARKEDVVMVVYEDYTVDIALISELQAAIGLGTIPLVYICIGFNEIRKRINPKAEIPNFYNIRIQLTKEELNILDKIASKKFSSINIKLKNGKVNIIEATKISDAITNEQILKNMRKILADGDYQTIVLTMQDGKVQTLLQTFKEKP